MLWCTALFYIYLPTWINPRTLLWINRCDHTQLGFVVATVIRLGLTAASGLMVCGAGRRRRTESGAEPSKERTDKDGASATLSPLHTCHVTTLANRSSATPATCHYPPTRPPPPPPHLPRMHSYYIFTPPR